MNKMNTQISFSPTFIDFYHICIHGEIFDESVHDFSFSQPRNFFIKVNDNDYSISSQHEPISRVFHHAATPTGTSNLGKTANGLITSLPNRISHPSFPR
jgi:hypothetical protein